MKKLIALILAALLLINIPIYAENNEYIDYRVTASALNVRAFGSLDAPIVGLLYKGAIVRGDNDTTDWANVLYNGKLACVSRQYLTPYRRGERTYFGRVYVTGYTPDPAENGGSSVNCFGEPLAPLVGQIVAVDPSILPLKKQVYIDGLGEFETRDTGVIGTNIDVLVGTIGEAYSLTGWYDLYITE